MNSMSMFEFCDNATSSSARTFRTSGGPRNSSSGGCPAWSLSPLMEVLPESPSPICSPQSSRAFSPKSCRFYSHGSSDLFAPRNQCFCTTSNCSKQSISCIEVNDWMEHAQQRYDHFHNHSQECSSKCYKSSLSMRDNEFDGLPVPLEKEESSVHEYSHQACARGIYEPSEAGSIDAQQHELMTRPKPYHAFLDEVKQQELEAEIDSRRKAKQMELMDKLRRKETAISDWELKTTSKVMEEMKKFESELEKRRAKAFVKTQHKISKTKAEANKKMDQARRKTIVKISETSIVSARIRAPRNSIWIKLMRLF
ncbi:hypothetical protein FNV43_RR18322 [Rhamnella rubrinervis]|uniref:Remorin C-terminal domain-containing protein n=1 Tax=Rhamnella rubrinervis TaxID=2594499 RepID=A0A8K0E627_9ROSA|nr:hypothetical protein FNV43_RR18322 [Rhamnella rubrinervis]